MLPAVVLAAGRPADCGSEGIWGSMSADRTADRRGVLMGPSRSPPEGLSRDMLLYLSSAADLCQQQQAKYSITLHQAAHGAAAVKLCRCSVLGVRIHAGCMLHAAPKARAQEQHAHAHGLCSRLMDVNQAATAQDTFDIPLVPPGLFGLVYATAGTLVSARLAPCAGVCLCCGQAPGASQVHVMAASHCRHGPVLLL